MLDNNCTVVNIVTACDTRYAKLAKGLINSVFKSLMYYYKKPQMRFPFVCELDYECNDYKFIIKFCILDCGLDAHEVEYFIKAGAEVVKFTEFSLPTKENQLPHMAAYLERFNIVNIFTGSDVTMWIDSDAWVQNFSEGLWPYIINAIRGNICIVPEVDRNIAFNMRHRDITLGWSYGNYTKFFGVDAANAYTRFPMLNNGVFSAPSNSPMWKEWGEAMNFALINNEGKPEFGIDQISLNWLLYTRRSEIKIQPLPFLANWMITHCEPMQDDTSLRFVEPIWPYAEIGIIHMLDNTKWNRCACQRIDKTTGKILTGTALHWDYLYHYTDFWK